MTRRIVAVTVTALALTLMFHSAANAQVGKSQGLADANTAPEAELAKMPSMTPEIAKALVAARPFDTAVDLNKFLLSQKLTQEQANAFYAKAFVHINLNTATNEEILLVPGAGRRMAREFPEYRPWRTYAQFDKEIGKYVGAEATAKLAQYTFIPMNANTAADNDLMTVPGATQAWADAVKKGRPYKTAADLEKTAGKAQARFFVVE